MMKRRGEKSVCFFRGFSFIVFSEEKRYSLYRLKFGDDDMEGLCKVNVLVLLLEYNRCLVCDIRYFLCLYVFCEERLNFSFFVV